MTVQDGVSPALNHDALLAEGWKPLEASTYIDLVGQVYFKADGADTRYGFIAEAKHKNRRNVIHGGVLAAFADRALAMAGRRVNEERPQATIELSIRFIDAVQIGEFIDTVPEIVRKTRSIIFVRSILMVGSRTVATADGIWKILSPK